MTVKIDKIVIQIGDRLVLLTLDQAQELQQVLNDTFGEKRRPIYLTYPRRPAPSWYVPPYQHWDIWCGVSGSDGTLTCSLN